MKTSTRPPLPSKQYTRDAKWIARHYGDLVRKHANKWVAVHKGCVVAVGGNPRIVQQRAQRLTGFEEIPVQLIDDATIIYYL